MNEIALFLARLKRREGNVNAQAALAADLLLARQPVSERSTLHAVMDACALLHWFDAPLLARVLNVSPQLADDYAGALAALPFVECFGTAVERRFNVHEATRLGWRRQLFENERSRFVALSKSAAGCFELDEHSGVRVEHIYHLLCGDPERGATEVESINVNWMSRPSPESRNALAVALSELEENRLIEGRARVEVLLFLAVTRWEQAYTDNLLERADLALGIAQALGHKSAEARAHWVRGYAYDALGQTADSQAAFEQCLTISRAASSADPTNDYWQRQLAAALNLVADALVDQGQLDSAHPYLVEGLAIKRQLLERISSDAARQLEIGWTQYRLSKVWLLRGENDQAQAANDEFLEITRGLVQRDSENVGWQKALARALDQRGDVASQKGDLAIAESAILEADSIWRHLLARYASVVHKQGLMVNLLTLGDLRGARDDSAGGVEALLEALSIARQLYQVDPTSSDRQTELAGVLVHVGISYTDRGDTVRAEQLCREAIEVLRGLVEVAPSKITLLLRQLSVALNRLANVLEIADKIDDAAQLFDEALEIDRKLASANSIDATMQRELAISLSRVAGIRLQREGPAAALPLFEEASQIMRVLMMPSTWRVDWEVDREHIDTELQKCRAMIADSSNSDGTK